jgi:hypothetical protein
LFPATCFSGSLPDTSDARTDNIETWKAYDIPDKALLTDYNYSLDDWLVYAKDDSVYITDNRKGLAEVLLPFKVTLSFNDQPFQGGKKSVLKVSNGYLVGFYRGEWGGDLFWFSDDGKDCYKISDHRIVQFLIRGNKIYAIEGLAHISSSEGSIIEIKNVGGTWKASEYLTLPLAPEAAAVDQQENFIVITSGSLLKVNKEARIMTLVEQGFWQYYLYPSSMVIKDDVVYIGMRKGALKYDLTTGIQRWLLPN